MFGDVRQFAKKFAKRTASFFPAVRFERQAVSVFDPEATAPWKSSREFFEEQSQIVDVVLLLLDHDDGEVAIR